MVNWNIKNSLFNYFQIMAEENISKEFRFKKTDETRNFFIEKINKNE